MSTAVVRYEPRGAALELMTCRDPEVLIAGPAGTGKSLAMLYKMHYSAMQVEGLRALLVRQTHSSLTGTTLVTFERNVATYELAEGSVRWFGGSSRAPAAYHYPNTGAVILVGGLDRPEKFLSSEFDRIGIDEATEVNQNAYETLISRLRGTAGTYRQIVAACNPAAPSHWIKGRADSGRMRMLYSRHRDNPAFVNLDGSLTPRGGDYLSKLDALTGMRRQRLLEGRWSAAEGLVYEEFDPAVHLVDRLPPGSDRWERWWALDFGWRHPFVWLSFAEDPDGRLYLEHEIHMTSVLVEDHAARIKRVVCPGGTWIEPRPRAIVADHDAEDRATFERHFGMSTRPAHKGVSDGIQAVQSRLRVQADGKPRLFILKSALVEADPALVEAKKPTCLADELLCYAWPPDVKPGARENPLKENDDSCDALRYVVAEREIGRQPRYRSFTM